MRFEGFCLAELGAKLLEHVLEQERNDASKANSLLLVIRKPSNGLPRNERCAIFRFDVLQHSRGMAHERNRLSVGKRLLN